MTTRPSRRRWTWLLCATCVVPLLAVSYYDRLLAIASVGRTDLEVVFLVTDAGTNRPLSGARIEVLASDVDGAANEHDGREFALLTDADGEARRALPHTQCWGTRSGLGFTDTFRVELPNWQVRVTVPGYLPSESVNLIMAEHARQVRRTGPGRAELVVPLSMCQDPEETCGATSRVHRR